MVVIPAMWPSAAVLTSSALSHLAQASSCDTVQRGYQCDTAISRNWGQYSPYFSVPSNISADVPPTCTVSFVQMLSRHGARDPTASKTTEYNHTIAKIRDNVKSYRDTYAFLQDYQYALGADQLTKFGQQEMVNSGIKFSHRYKPLTDLFVPFIRASGEARVVESAYNWTQGFHQAKRRRVSDPTYPYDILVISEEDGSNNTLNHGLCTAFEKGLYSKVASSAQSTWSDIFVPPIQQRLNANLAGANLTASDTINMMDLCPFNTVASDDGAISPFCDLFTSEEFRQYGHYENLNKYYGYGAGNPLGPTQGVGWTNELIARLTGRPVHDHTSTNHTLDDNNPSTFPLNRVLYADFGHDNDMTAVFFALGLYNTTAPLSNTTVESTNATHGYSASWTVPFAARMYVEKWMCTDQPGQELVRILVNDRVIPLTTCGADARGMCPLRAFVASLTFAQHGGRWDEC